MNMAYNNNNDRLTAFDPAWHTWHTRQIN